MKSLSPLIATIALCACKPATNTQPLPSSIDVDHVERLLAAQPCIGSLSGWERQYRLFRNTTYHDPDRGKLSRSIIEFTLRQAVAKYGIRPSRQVRPPRQMDVVEIDDTPVDVAFGSFDLKTGKLQIDFCGPNFPK